MRRSFLRTYACVSLVVVGILALVLAERFSTRVSGRALETTAEQIALATDLSVRPIVNAATFVDGPSIEQRRALERLFTATGGPSNLKNIGLRRTTGEVVFSTFDLDRVRPDDPLLLRARSGALASEWVESKRSIGAGLAGRYARVVVPVRGGADDDVVGLAETYVDASQVKARSKSDRRAIIIQLVLGLLALWLALFRLVSGASRLLRRQSEENRFLAMHDQLTGLPNRTKFEAIARPAIEKALLARKNAGIVLVDLDRFKEVNDTLGHANGDRLLQQVGPRLRSAMRDGDVLARLGGDEFVVLLRDIENAQHADLLAAAMLKSLHSTFEVADIPVVVEASFGVAVAPADGRTYETLLQKADVAMYRAKARKTGVQHYDQSFDRRSVDRLALLAELRTAIDDDAANPENAISPQLHLQYQPKIDLRSWTIVGAEALIRWRHPTRGPVSPGEFIPLAEASGLMRPLTSLVMRHAFRQQKQWSLQGVDAKVSVNISAPNLVDVGLVDEVADALVAAGIEPKSVILEITETGVMNDPDRSIATLHRLRALGVGLSIDDFGVGQSSLGYLKQLPVTELKLDRLFVSRILDDERDEAIVRATVRLGEALGLSVVAEGIETQEELDRLAEIGCAGAQGFFLGRPVLGDEFVGVVSRGLPGRAPVGAVIG